MCSLLKRNSIGDCSLKAEMRIHDLRCLPSQENTNFWGANLPLCPSDSGWQDRAALTGTKRGAIAVHRKSRDYISTAVRARKSSQRSLSSFFHSRFQTSACGNNWGQEHRAPKARKLDIGRSESQLEGAESWVLWSPHTAQKGQVFLAGNTEDQSFPVGFMVSDEMKLLGPFSIL